MRHALATIILPALLGCTGTGLVAHRSNDLVGLDSFALAGRYGMTLQLKYLPRKFPRLIRNAPEPRHRPAPSSRIPCCRSCAFVGTLPYLRCAAARLPIASVVGKKYPLAPYNAGKSN